MMLNDFGLYFYKSIPIEREIQTFVGPWTCWTCTTSSLWVSSSDTVPATHADPAFDAAVRVRARVLAAVRVRARLLTPQRALTPRRAAASREKRRMSARGAGEEGVFSHAGGPGHAPMRPHRYVWVRQFQGEADADAAARDSARPGVLPRRSQPREIAFSMTGKALPT